MGRCVRHGSKRSAPLSDKPTIRLAKRADVRTLALLSRKEIEHGLPWSWTPTRLKRFLNLGSTNAYVAEVSGQVVGFSVASLGDARAHLVLLAVDRAFRHRGIGRELLEWQLLAAQTAGLADMSLEVRAANRTAQLFYASAGFQKVRSLPRYYCGVEDAVRFRLTPIRSSRRALENDSPAQ